MGLSHIVKWMDSCVLPPHLYLIQPQTNSDMAEGEQWGGESLNHLLATSSLPNYSGVASRRSVGTL